GFRLDGVGTDRSGLSVSSAGDFNGDGFADLIVGAPDTGWVHVSPGRGASYVVLGKASGFNPSIDLGSLDGSNGFRLDAPVSSSDWTGYSVSSADVNGDGFDDLVIGAPLANGNGQFYGYGVTYVIFGQAPTEDVTRTGTDVANRI